MKRTMKIIYLILSVVFLLYLLIPKQNFPDPPQDSLQSNEPADTETPFRRAYFTNFTREEVIKHYQNQFQMSWFFGIKIPSYKLNYPPEEAQTLIRDQTRSTFLEEIVYPFRESLFVNGFEPKDEKDIIFIGGKDWKQKITVRYYSSLSIFRIVIFSLSLLLLWLILKEWVYTIKGIFQKKN